jgi:hypothetical protein
MVSELEALGLNLPTLADLYDLEIKVEWTVDKLIPSEAVTVIHGQGGLGKTWLLLQLGSCVADGKPFCGLETMKGPAYYIDFENPVAELCNRARILGRSSLQVWHLSHTPAPPRLDSREWESYKLLSPGLIIFDSIRAAHNLDENSSKDMTFIMGRLKELRSYGHTVIGILHSPKGDARNYRGSSALVDQCDHSLGMEKVKKVGSDEVVDMEDEVDLPIRLGVIQKTRFSPYKMYVIFDPAKGFRLADNPENSVLREMYDVLKEHCQSFNAPSQTQFKDLITGRLGFGKAKFLALAKRGEGMFWTSYIDKKHNNKLTYTPVFCSDEE